LSKTKTSQVAVVLCEITAFSYYDV